MAKLGTYIIAAIGVLTWVAALAFYLWQLQPPGNLPPDDTALALFALGLVFYLFAYAHERTGNHP